MSKEEIEVVNFNYASLYEMTKKYNPAKMLMDIINCQMARKYIISQIQLWYCRHLIEDLNN